MREDILEREGGGLRDAWLECRIGKSHDKKKEMDGKERGGYDYALSAHMGSREATALSFGVIFDGGDSNAQGVYQRHVKNLYDTQSLILLANACVCLADAVLIGYVVLESALLARSHWPGFPTARPMSPCRSACWRPTPHSSQGDISWFFVDMLDDS